MQPFALALAALAVAANAAMHWSGSTHAQTSLQANDLRLTAAWQQQLASKAKMHSMWTQRAKLQGEHEAEQTEKALRAWIEHQQRSRLPIIQKNPDAADHVNVHAWYKAYHDPKGQSIRAWHKELAETYESKHVKNIDTALDASFDKQGRYMPRLNVPHQPSAALKCCKTECGLGNHQRWMAGQGRYWTNETAAWIEWLRGDGGRDEAGRKTTTGAPHVDTPPGKDNKYHSLNPVWRGVKHDWGSGLTVQNAGSMN